MMAEAQAMMNDPNFQKKMKEMQKSKEYQETIKKTKDVMADPTKAAQAEAKLEIMTKIGNDEIKKNAANAMEEAMAAMNDPNVMNDLAKMMKDPKFKDTIASMANDNQFQEYINAMKNMMANDPATKRKVENIASTLKATL